jgi:hypothetical protein
MLPSPNVPCSLTPPQSPVTIASCGDLLLPSSQYDSVGLRMIYLTRLTRFTLVTARALLCRRDGPCCICHDQGSGQKTGEMSHHVL